MVHILETFSQSKKIRSALECHTEEKAVGGDERGFSPVFVLVLPNITFNQQEKLEAVLSKIIWVFIATSNLNHNVGDLDSLRQHRGRARALEATREKKE